MIYSIIMSCFVMFSPNRERLLPLKLSTICSWATQVVFKNLGVVFFLRSRVLRVARLKCSTKCWSLRSPARRILFRRNAEREEQQYFVVNFLSCISTHSHNKLFKTSRFTRMCCLSFIKDETRIISLT